MMIQIPDGHSCTMASSSFEIWWGKTNLAQRQVLCSKSKRKLESWGPGKGMYVRWLIVRGCTLNPEDSVFGMLEDLGLVFSRNLWHSSHSGEDSLMISASSECSSCRGAWLKDNTCTLLGKSWCAFSSCPHAGSFLKLSCLRFFPYKMTYVLVSRFRQAKSKQQKPCEKSL